MTSMFDRSRQFGRAVGWRLVFPTLNGLTFSHASHYARIEATLPSGLAGGNCRIEIEAMNTLDFGVLAMARQPGSPNAEPPLVKAELTLFWRDRVGDEPVAALAPVTAVLGVTALARVAEGTRLKTTIECQDWIYLRLARARVRQGRCPIGPIAALRLVLEDAGLDASEYVLHPASDANPAGGPDLTSGESVLEVLDRIGERLADESHRRGRGPFLIREGVLHAGTSRPIPFAPTPLGRSEPYDLGPAEGLVRAENQGPRSLSSAERREEAESGRPTLARDGVSLTLVGRPDLKPGDVVRVPVDSAERALFGGFGLAATPAGVSATQTVQVYIASVQHRLGKNQGWLTTANGVVVVLSPTDEDAPWDIAAPAEAGSGSAGGGDVDAADPAETTANLVRRSAREEMRRRQPAVVGEVRANHQDTEMEGSRATRAAQSVDVLVGLEGPAGASRRARREPVRRSDPAWPNVPYLTPFAWGPYGLVLPQYPGSRVLLNFHEGQRDDPVVLGSMWRTDAASSTATPQNTQPGDWWLILPAALDADARTRADGTEEVRVPDSAKATHDLIDATGSRVLQVRELTIRALPEGDLGTPQTRPEAGADGGVLITHKNGARILIDSEGAITIEATKGLTLKAAEDVNIEGRNIYLKGNTVDVQS